MLPLYQPVAALGGSRRRGGTRAAGMTRRPHCPTDAQPQRAHVKEGADGHTNS